MAGCTDLVAFDILIFFGNQVSLHVSRKNCCCMFKEVFLNHMDFADFFYINCFFHFLQ